jgi:muramidase (phage lysozyme)
MNAAKPPLHPNVRALLEVIAWCEIGPALLAASDNGYNVCVGSTPAKPILFGSYAAHPRLRSEAMNSDAAGRYQFMGRYWAHYKRQLGLPDFGKDSQDRWAIHLIKECKALEDVIAGRFATAVSKCRSRWASFPGAGYGQPEKNLAAMAQVFVKAGGVLA